MSSNNMYVARERKEPLALSIRNADDMGTVGRTRFDWNIAENTLSWEEGTERLLGIDSLLSIATTEKYEAFFSIQPGIRLEAIKATRLKDSGEGVPYKVRYIATRPAGEKGREAPMWVEETGVWYSNKDGRPQRAEASLRVIDEHQSLPSEVQRLEFFDPVTNLLNRDGLQVALREAIEEASSKSYDTALLVMRINGLEDVNRNFGLDAGDAVLRQLARRVAGRMRYGDILARLSGAQFALVLRECAVEEMALAAERFIRAVRDSVTRTTMGPAVVDASVGGVSIPSMTTDCDDAIRMGQETAEEAKAMAFPAFAVHNTAVASGGARGKDNELASLVADALEQNRFRLAYQPIIYSSTRAPVFHEALLRIKNADGSVMEASSFIQVAKRFNLIRLIDRHALGLAIQDLIDHPKARLSLNVSSQGMTDPDWFRQLEEAAQEHPDIMGRLTVELSEPDINDCIDDACNFARQLRGIGFGIALDNFGAGFSSFSILKRVQADIVKIDGNLVTEVMKSGQHQNAVRSLIDFADELDVCTVVVEWVDTFESASLFTNWGADYLQGNVFGIPNMERPWEKEEAVFKKPKPMDFPVQSIHR